MNEKRCSICEEVKELSEFYSDKGRPDGHRSACRECIRTKRKRIKAIKICERKDCEKELQRGQKKYCSRLCSVTVSNTLRRITKFCENAKCGKLITSKNAHRNNYCCVKCSVAVLNQQRLKTWLETGIGIVGSSPTHYIRSYIFGEQKGLCSVCSGVNEHNGKPLVFILDHIDGNAENNSRENLRLVCPNCDSQLDTYKSKNKGKGRHSRRQRYAEGKSF